ncbi:MAG: hypothetical protein ABFD92_00115 [Planctomycetaceae bacterium]|nr:hypothetical protein [Planctomycetaceae bacterium]
MNEWVDGCSGCRADGRATRIYPSIAALILSAVFAGCAANNKVQAPGLGSAAQSGGEAPTVNIAVAGGTLAAVLLIVAILVAAVVAIRRLGAALDVMLEREDSARPADQEKLKLTKAFVRAGAHGVVRRHLKRIRKKRKPYL